MLVFNKLVFFITFSLIDPHIYLYHTPDGLQLEFYDCVLFQSLYYCRRPTLPINLTRDHYPESCQINGGQLHTFSELRAKRINTSIILHQWRSSIERVEQYSRYLIHSTANGDDGYICQCIDSASFGKNCEYQLPVGNTFQETLDWRLITRQENPNQVQIHGDIVCHTTLTCNSAPLCLDWREICDGIQNCAYARDEENCDLLEMNMCDDDEYRCMNGMCIPQEYFLDGEFDCLDWSDEMQYMKSEECARESVSVRCDDHICPPNEWPCGDGQCIRDRLAFRVIIGYETCQNRRDQYFMCESNAYPFSWTMLNGRCHEGKLYEGSLQTIQTHEEYCEYLLRCDLSHGGEQHCLPPRRPNWTNEIRQHCLNQWIVYPKRPWVTSFSYMSHIFISNFEGYLRRSACVVYGTVRCQRSIIVITKNFLISLLENPSRTIHDNLCRKVYEISFTEIPVLTHDCHHQNQSTNMCDEWNACMSITRLRDGFINCLNRRDESEEDHRINVYKSCSRVQRYRFHCSTEQSTCLSIMALGNGKLDCKNEFDELWLGTNRPLSQIHCNDRKTHQCSLLRRHIEQSWQKTSDHEQVSLMNQMIPFRSYCDTFWDFDPPEDENQTECQRSWVCDLDQLYCGTKQCFDRHWQYDREWDCPNATDEAEQFGWLATHVRQITESANASDSQSDFLLSTCNQTHEQFLCLFPFTSYPQFHCIHRSQIGNGRIDCAGAIDERGILKHCSQSQPLGSHFLCVSTNTCIPYFHHCQPGYRCPNRTDDESWCSLFDRSVTCPNFDDFMCLDGSCKQGGRCNERFECSYLEDEYMCDYPSTAKQKMIRFRSEKQFQRNEKRKTFQLPDFPPDAVVSQQTITNDTTTQFTLTTPTDRDRPSPSAYLTAYRCNRGIGVLSIDNQTVCFCPPQYYGDRCQYQNDRLSVLLHLNLSQSTYAATTDPNITLKLLLIFFDHNRTLMTHEFHFRPAFEDTINEKKRVHFFYSHASDNRQRRENRYRNRSDILQRHPHSIQIDLYELRPNQRPLLVSVWKYPLFFDYLPVSHFAKVLHLRRVNATQNACPPNAACYPLMNDLSQHVCACQANYSREDCSNEDEECRDGHCAEGSLCKSNYRAAHRGNHHPYCVCLFGRAGDRCDIELDLCDPNPCQNGGSCLSSSTLDQTTCLCTKEFYGDKCQFQKRHIRLAVDTSVQFVGVVIQYFDIDFISLDLDLVHQQVYRFMPRQIEYYYIQPYAPNIVLAKFHASYDDVAPQTYVLSLSNNIPSIEAKTIISDSNHCQHVQQRFTGILFSILILVSILSLFLRDMSPIRYHSLCQNDTALLCFRDDHYLCICVDNHTRVECFIYDQQLDHCSNCLHNGRCLRGDPTRSIDFVCLCPLCYSGGQCQFSSKSFTFTLDQLFYTDLVMSHRSRIVVTLLIFFSALGFILAIPNNLFSFVTFRQRSCRRNGVGHYLLTLSVISQLNLALLVVRLTHLSLNIVHRSSSTTINTILCKVLNYSLVSSSRLVYWLSSLIAIERVYMSVVLNGQWLKQPRIARRLILFTAVTTLFTTTYEYLFFRSFSISDETERSMCIFEFPHAYRSQWMIVHVFMSTLHSVVPFVINLCSTITISIMVVKKKMNTRRTQKSQRMNFVGRIRFILTVLNENRELVIGPGLTLIPQLFSLPLFISSFTVDCQNIENSWIRFLLITSYWTSFTPQIISFFLYISPSSFYSDEWRKTQFRQRITSIL